METPTTQTQAQGTNAAATPVDKPTKLYVPILDSLLRSTKSNAALDGITLADYVAVALQSHNARRRVERMRVEGEGK